MNDRRQRAGKRPTTKRRESTQPLPLDERELAQRDDWFQHAGVIMAEEVLPGIEAFRAYMTAQQRKLEVMPFLDHIEGPRIMVHISRPDGRIIATLIAAVAPAGIHPYWDVTSTGRVKTHWMESVAGGPAGLTRDNVREKLIELYTTDFS